MSRKMFVYSSLTLATLATGVLLLHSAFTAIIPDPTAAGIVTAIAAAFGCGIAVAILIIRFGAWLKTTVGERLKEIPPRRIYLSPTQTTTPTPATNSHNMETEYQPRVLVENGITRLLDHPQDNHRADVIEWTEFDPQQSRYAYHAIDLATLRRFARLHTPCRSEWSGRATTYGEALACFKHHGWVHPTGIGKGVEWVHPYTKTNRRLAYLGDTAALPSPQ